MAIKQRKKQPSAVPAADEVADVKKEPFFQLIGPYTWCPNCYWVKGPIDFFTAVADTTNAGARMEEVQTMQAKKAPCGCRYWGLQKYTKPVQFEACREVKNLWQCATCGKHHEKFEDVVQCCL